MVSNFRMVDSGATQSTALVSAKYSDKIAKELLAKVAWQKILLATSSSSPVSGTKKHDEPISVNIAAYRETPKEGYKRN